MANLMYEKGRNAFLTGSIIWTGSLGSSSPAVALVASTYTASQFVADVFYNTVPQSAVVASAILANPSASDGVADADDVTFSSISGSKVTSVVLYNWTGNTATSRLILYLDTMTGLPVTPNGGNITLTFDSGTCKIFRL